MAEKREEALREALAIWRKLRPEINHLSKDGYKLLAAFDAALAQQPAPPPPPAEGLREALTKHMVNRFLGWRLPADFGPDAGISFKPPANLAWWPIGTNLFTATQAEAMVRHMIDGMRLADDQLAMRDYIVWWLRDEAQHAGDSGAVLRNVADKIARIEPRAALAQSPAPRVDRCPEKYEDEEDGGTYECALAVGHFGRHMDRHGICDWSTEPVERLQGAPDIADGTVAAMHARGDTRCAALCQPMFGGLACTRPPGHAGSHAAFGSLSDVTLLRWDVPAPLLSEKGGEAPCGFQWQTGPGGVCWTCIRPKPCPEHPAPPSGEPRAATKEPPK